MTKSLPSKRIAYVDVPEVTSFSAKFVYDFFTIDERTNDLGVSTSKLAKTLVAHKLDNAFTNTADFRRFTPRFVKFSWNPMIDEKHLAGKHLEGRPIPLLSGISIKNNLQKIHNEQTFSSDEYTNIYMQDTDADKKLNFFIKRALSELRTRLPSEGKLESGMDIINFLNDELNKNIDSKFLTEAFLENLSTGHTFLDPERNEQIVNTVTDEVSQVKIRMQINNKVISHLLETTKENTINIFNDEVGDLFEEAKIIQEKAIAQKSSTLIDGHDYDFEVLEFINYKTIDSNFFEPTVQVIGYIIDKIEIGSNVVHESIIIENPRANSAIDLKVKYGARYKYSMRTIAFIEMQVKDSETNSVVALSFLVSSKPSSKIVVLTEEDVPPPPPSDFTISWCHTTKSNRLMWNFPVNSQRDIKRFQVLRRRSIREPFQLIREYDFDDSQTRAPMREAPDPYLIQKLTSPKTFYLDGEFNKNSRFIYAICSIDAHGLTSNYSMQIEVTFDKFKNKLANRLISLSGAPKAYPNAYLNSDTFVDTIKDSGHGKVEIYFNPEYLKATDSSGVDVGLLNTHQDSNFKLQLINIDLQQQKTVSINIDDRRSEYDKRRR